MKKYLYIFSVLFLTSFGFANAQDTRPASSSSGNVFSDMVAFGWDFRWGVGNKFIGDGSYLGIAW